MQQSDKVTMLKDSFLAELEGTFAVSLADATDLQRYQALATVAKKLIASKWRRTKENYRDTGAKQVYYFSIEFLPGRYLRANLLNLGLLTEAEEVMQDLGVDFNALLEAEVDQGLGNGGFGPFGVRLYGCHTKYRACWKRKWDSLQLRFVPPSLCEWLPSGIPR